MNAITPNTPATDDKYRAPALEKGLDILEVLSGSSHGLTQAEMAKSLGRSPNEIYRMLNTLVRRGYISKSLTGERYQLSMKMFTLAHRHPPFRRLIDHALPLLKEAAKKTRQSCLLGIEHRGEIVISASIESPENWGLSLRTGSVIGLSNTGTGRVLAAFKSPRRREAMIDGHELVDGEPEIVKSEFLEVLDKVREHGYEKMPSGITIGVTNLSVPVLGHDGQSIAALTCPYLERVDGVETPDVDEVLKIIAEVANTLSMSYGYEHSIDVGEK